MSKSSEVSAKKAPVGKQANGRWISHEEMLVISEKLREAQETLDAIRNGEVDAVVVSGEHGHQVYSLSGAEQPYRVYVEQMQEGAVTVSPEGLILYCNQRFAEMVQQPLEKVISSAFTDRISAETWASIAAFLHSTEDASKHEDVLHVDGDRHLSVSITASKLPLEDQHVLCLVVADLTTIKEKESLRLAKEISDRANEAKDVFLAALSHELRTPLTPALIAVSDLESGLADPAEILGTASLIRRCIELETRLIDDLLDITRIARGKLELYTASMDLHTALSRAIELCQNDITGKKLQLHIDLQATHHQTEGDMVRTQQVFWNILRNAIKFTPEQGHITIRSSNQGPDQITFEITDSGIGFDEHTPSRLFAAFEQEDETVARSFGGRGLGLTISKSVVDAHGGTITAKSDGKNKGATFVIQLPLRATNTADTPAASASPAAGSPKSPSVLRLLVVEDHKDTRIIMEKLLRRMGHQVHVAETASQALAIAADTRLDLVISDVGLPDMTGWQLMQQLRDRHGLKGIAVSGFGTGHDISESHDSGFVHHLTKPLSVEALSRALSNF